MRFEPASWVCTFVLLANLLNVPTQMNPRLLAFTFFIFWMSCSGLYAQQVEADTILDLENITISGTRNRIWAHGVRTESLTADQQPASPSNHLGQTLSDMGIVYVRSYGVSMLSTLSLRGGSSNHTAITWHGFNINSPMNGITDLALIPQPAFNGASIHYGGTSSLWGGSAVGGQIALGKRPEYGHGWGGSFSATAGSFGRQSQNLSLSYGNGSSSSRITMFNTATDNDYLYEKTVGQDKVRLTNAYARMYGLMAENHFKLTDRQKVGIHLWLQKADRQLPPAVWQDESKARQKDDNIRAVAEYALTTKKAMWLMRGAYFGEKQNYKDPAWSTDDDNGYDQYTAETELRAISLKNHRFNLGANLTHVNASSDNYDKLKTQTSSSIFGSWSYQPAGSKWKTGLNLRKEWIPGVNIPFIFSAGAEYKIALKWNLMANAGKVFRNPTLNERFWTFGGNPDLAPESGYTADLCLQFRHMKEENTGLKFEAGLFYKNIRNWINWSPDSSGLWQPRNLSRVLSYGVEARTQWTTSLGKTFNGVQINTTLQTSRTTESITPDDPALDKNLIYVPALTSMVRIFTRWKGLDLSVRHNYTSRRYTLADNTAFLPGFGLLSMRVGYKTTVRKAELETFLELNNAAGNIYTITEAYPMPGRNMEAGIVVRL